MGQGSSDTGTNTGSLSRSSSFEIIPPNIVHEKHLPNGLRDQTITIRGTVHSNPERFSIKLHKDNHIAFKFNPRFNEGGRRVIVRNSLFGNDWGPEERDLSSFPFKPGEPFEVEILCTDSEFRVKVDKKDLLSYRHRIREIDQIKKLTVEGDVLIQYVNIENTSGGLVRSSSFELLPPDMALMNGRRWH